MAMKLYSETAIQDIADAIRSKNGSSDTYTVAEMAQAIEDISSGVDWTGLIDGDYSQTDVVYEGTTFTSSIPIAYVYIKSLSMPNMVSPPSNTGWGRYGHWEEIYLPKLTTLGLYGLRDCPRMTKAYVPKVTNVGTNYGFGSCSALTSIALPAITGEITAQTFSGCSHLQSADFGNTTGFANQAFLNASVLTTIVLRKSSVVRLANVSAFNGTPFRNGGTGGTIYIPEDLYDHLGDGTASDYQSATNWSTVHGYGTITWAKIEGSYYETHYADGTEITV